MQCAWSCGRVRALHVLRWLRLSFRLWSWLRFGWYLLVSSCFLLGLGLRFLLRLRLFGRLFGPRLFGRLCRRRFGRLLWHLLWRLLWRLLRHLLWRLLRHLLRYLLCGRLFSAVRGLL